MWPFRRKAGRHELGAAVTGIPSVVRTVPAPAQAPAPVPPPVAAVAYEPPPLPEYAPPAPPEPDGPRVELGFRDGSTAALAPDSAQAKALTDLASVLTQRD